MKRTRLARGFEGLLVRSTPTHRTPSPNVRASDDSITSVAGVALWGPLLDRLGLIEEADRRGVRPIGPGGYSGGECYRPLVEMLLSGGDFLSDRYLLADEATATLRGKQALPSHTTMWRFLDESDLGRVMKMSAVNREMIRRAWAMGAAPKGEILTIVPDATLVRTYGKDKEGSKHSYQGKPALHPIIGIVGETGEVLGVRARGGSSQAGRAMGSFTTECISAIPSEVRDRYRLWVCSDSAGYQKDLIEAAEKAGAWWSVTAKQFAHVEQTIYALVTDQKTVWRRAQGDEAERGSQVAEGELSFAKRTVRLVVRRQPKEGGDQLAFDDVDGYRFHALITNIPKSARSAVKVEAHHRLRAGIPEDSIKWLKEDFGFVHAPLQNFFGNWSWWLACALAYNTSVWLKILGLPEEFRFAAGKRLRLHFLNVAARITTSGRQLFLNLSRNYRYLKAFIRALNRIRALPAFG